MSTSGALDVRNAVCALLRGDSTLTSTYGASVYQEPPERAVMPYIHLTSEQVSSWETLAREGRELTIVVHCWADDSRDDLIQLMHDRVVALLNRASLSVSNWTFVHCDYISSDQVSGPVHDNYIARFRVYIHE